MKPTPLGETLKLVGTTKEINQRKVIVDINLIEKDEICVSGTIIAVRMKSL